MKVIIIDDYPGFAELLKTWIESLYPDWTVHAYDEWPRGKDALENDKFELVVVDVMMPGVSAEEILNFISSSQPDASVIVMSGFSDAELALEELPRSKRKNLVFLKKPFTQEELVDTIKKVVRPT